MKIKLVAPTGSVRWVGVNGDVVCFTAGEAVDVGGALAERCLSLRDARGGPLFRVVENCDDEILDALGVQTLWPVFRQATNT